MLQQTQVARVIPAWERFLASFPTPGACADAPRAEVVRAWEGLGYHRRAVALHRSAQQIVDVHDGEVPDSFDALRALPGVGEYTARAVLAFAFERDVAVVDTNVARILARAIAGRPLAAREAQSLADDLVPAGHGWAHNQAMLDFGALRCTSVPRCTGCALRRSCAWARAGFADPDPAKTSAGTTRAQARFEGSDRQLRGQVLALARDGRAGGAALGELESKVGTARLGRIIAGLVDDGLVVRSEGGVALA